MTQVDIDDAPLTFGRHKGETPNTVAKTDPSYIVWLYEKTERNVVSEALYEDCWEQVDHLRDLEAEALGFGYWS